MRTWKRRYQQRTPPAKTNASRAPAGGGAVVFRYQNASLLPCPWKTCHTRSLLSRMLPGGKRRVVRSAWATASIGRVSARRLVRMTALLMRKAMYQYIDACTTTLYRIPANVALVFAAILFTFGPSCTSSAPSPNGDPQPSRTFLERNHERAPIQCRGIDLLLFSLSRRNQFRPSSAPMSLYRRPPRLSYAPGGDVQGRNTADTGGRGDTVPEGSER